MTKFILSIDGGGIRGVIPAVVLTVLVEKLAAKGKTLPLHRYFHLIAGTSTGAIIAAGLTCPKPGQPERPAADPQTLLDLYTRRGPEIFDKGLLDLGGFFNELYSANPLEQILQEILGTEAEIKDALSKVVITAYDIQARRAMFLSNVDQDHERFLFWQAVRGSSAAPTYFEPAQVKDLSDPGSTITLVDGGVFANDPSMAAYVEGCKLGWSGDIVMLSLGTGSSRHPISYAQAKGWGKLGWIAAGDGSPIISVMMQGQASTASYQVDRLLNPNLRTFDGAATKVTEKNRSKLAYFRVDGLLKPGTKPNDALDDVTPANIAALEKFGRSLAKQHGKALDELADRLQPT
jgi:predicted acylesterase/phospholipase RssA